MTELSEIRKLSSERIVAKIAEKPHETKFSARSPIGIFDSGVGGISTLKEMIKELPNEDVIYFADTARVPYGGRSAKEIININHEIIDYLIEQGVKLIIMACGTSSAIAYPVVANKYKLPIVALIEPGSRIAVRSSRSGKIGLIATVGTVDSGAFQRTIKEMKGTAEVYAAACPLFVPLIEGGFVEAEETKRVAREYLKPLMDSKIDTLILGCTHFPHLSGIIQEIVGPSVILVDPSAEAVLDAKALLKKKDLTSSGSKPATITYMVSGSVTQFKELASKLMGRTVTDVHKVNLVAKSASIE